MRKAGRHKQGWTYVLKHEPDYFGRKSLTSIRSLKRRESVVNVEALESLAQKTSTRRDGKIFVDLDELGYTKLLGKGRVTTPVVVKVSACSKLAAERIREAGGAILTEAEEKE
jgi:large subunit ribosomal protein L15